MSDKKKYEVLSAAEVVSDLNTDADSGITDAEAAGRLAVYGENKLEQGKKQSGFMRFLMQFTDIMIILLIVAAIVSLVFTIIEWESHGAGGLIEPIVIFAIIILNAIIGLVQEGKAERALEALKNLSAPTAKVIRDGKESVIEAAQVVPGDIITLDAGDYVPADARLLVSSSLKCEESALTGESVASEKDAKSEVKDNAAIGDMHNMVFTGTSVTYGTAKAVVCSTGMNTEMGKIASLLKGEKQSATPLQQKLASLGKYLTIIALAACVAILIIGIIQKQDIMIMIMTSISLAVSAIPEALPAVVTVVLSIGVQRMAARNAIIKKLPAVETLGCASVICSDKTGTLTQNRMTLISAYVDGQEKKENISDGNTAGVKKLLVYGTLCSNGSVEFDADGKLSLVGDPTETSIIAAAVKNGYSKSGLNNEMPRLAEFPFDSDRKLMSTVNKIDGKNIVIVKGAVDELLSRCISGDLEKAKTMTEKLSASALRVIGVAYKEVAEVPAANEELTTIESGLIFMGLVGMIDPPREEARQAVSECITAGIKTVMITGDHIITASAIATQLGILKSGDEAITGAQLEQMSEEELTKRIRNISVYARVSPTDKIRIVKAWQSLGEVVAMTGDGVNDAPALKAADIGCAMGITGTDVAKGAAAMTLTDDNFATIVDAVKEGRGVYDNIKRVVGYLLGTNVGEILVVLLATIIWKMPPLISIQLLWINLVTDSLPAIMLGMEKIDKDIMKQKPRPKKEGLFSNHYGTRIVVSGMVFAGLAIAAYAIGYNVIGNPAVNMELAHLSGSTMAFVTVAMSQIFHSYNMRSNRPLVKMNPFSNKMLNIAALIATVLMAIVVFIPPIAEAFNMTMLPVGYYFAALGLAFVPIIIMDALKLFGVIKHV